MVDISVDIDPAAVARFDALLARVAKECPRRLASETRRAAVYICKSLAAKTKVAPKRARASEIRTEVSPNPPRYIHSNSKGKQLLRRWRLTRLLGTPDEYAYDYYVTTSARRGKGGKMLDKNKAQERAELIRYHTNIARRGLAKKSWGWIAQKLYGTAGDDLSWKATRGQRRDPRNYVSGIFRAVFGGAFAEIRNSLDYAPDALKPGALPEALNNASKRLEFNINREMKELTA